MRRTNLRRYWVVLVAIGLRCTRRCQRACSPKLRVAVHALVRVAGGDGEHAVVLAVHVLAGAAAGAALTLAAAFSSGAAAQLLEVARVVAIGAVAVSAAIILVRRARGSVQQAQLRTLILATARRVDNSDAPVPAALALQLACEPRLLWAGPSPMRWAVRRAAHGVVSRVTKRPLASVLRVVGPALDVLGACRTTLDSAQFVRHFALTAVELSAEPRLLGPG